MLENLAFLVLGAVAGVATDRSWERVKARVSQRRGERKRTARARREDAIPDAVKRIYREEGYGSSLYVPTHLPTEAIAMLGGKGDVSSIPPVATEDFPLAVRVNTIDQMPVDRSTIQDRIQEGANIWDGELLYLISATQSGPHATDSPPALHAGVMNYFGYVSAAARWMKECGSSRPRPLLESHYKSLSDLLQNPPRPLALSAAAACVFNTPEGLRVPLAARSTEVVNSMGQLCVAPTFGLEPSTVDHVKSRFDVLKYNFLKEFLEEIYGKQHLARNVESGLLDPDAIFDDPDAGALLHEFDAGRAHLYVTGLAGNLSDGSVTVALLALFDSPAFYSTVRRLARPSWEWQPQEGSHQQIRFHELDVLSSPGSQTTLAQVADSSLFALDRALSVLALRGPTGEQVAGS